MRTSCRRLRHFRPWADSLESLAPVASLLPGIATIVPVTAFPHVETEEDHEGAPMAASPPSQPGNQPVSPTPSGNFVVMVGPTGNGPSGSASQPPPSGPATAEFSGALVTLSTPSVPSVTPISTLTAASQQPTVVPPRAGAAPPSLVNVASGAAAPSTSPVASTGTLPPGTAAEEGAEIRPMTLAPLPPSTPTSEVSSFSTLVDSGGGGGVPPDMPPVVDFSGGNTVQEVDANNDPIPGKYNVPTPVPIGTVTFITVSDPAPGYNIQTIAWSGGTTYSGYFSAPATQTPFGGQELEQNVATTTSNYIFIVDSMAKTYTINVNVTYTNGAKGSSTLTFTSVRPTGNLTVSQVGTQTVSGTVNPGQVTVLLNPGIKIQATASTGPNTAGDFMLMQVIDTVEKKLTTDQGQNRFVRNDIVVGNEAFNGPLIDNGASNTIGYDVTSQASGGPLNWSLGPNSSMPVAPAAPPEMIDNPQFGVPSSYLMVAENESFSTYLMYKPSGPPAGVWIALSQVDWSWSKSASRPVGGNWTTTPDSQQPNPTNTTPGGAAAFPTWVNTATNFNDQNLNPYRPGP